MREEEKKERNRMQTKTTMTRQFVQMKYVYFRWYARVPVIPSSLICSKTNQTRF
jgi:hypothetical protein